MPYNDRLVKKFKLVAVEGSNNDYAAYYGPAEWTDGEVADNGHKVTEEVANFFFPEWKFKLAWRL